MSRKPLMAFGSIWPVVIWAIVAALLIFTTPDRPLKFYSLFFVGLIHAISILEWWEQRKERTSRK